MKKNENTIPEILKKQFIEDDILIKLKSGEAKQFLKDSKHIVEDEELEYDENEYEFRYEDKQNNIHLTAYVKTEEYRSGENNAYIAKIIELTTQEYMRAYLTFRSAQGGYTKKPEIFSVGGFEFKIFGRSVMFDWNESYSGCEITDDGYLVLECELRNLDDEYSGFQTEKFETDETMVKLNADILLSLTEINEVYYECYMDDMETDSAFLHVEEFVIGDRPVPEKLLEEYNRKMYEEWK